MKTPSVPCTAVSASCSAALPAPTASGLLTMPVWPRSWWQNTITRCTPLLTRSKHVIGKLHAVRVQRSFTWYGVCSMQSIKSTTLNTITAATKLGDDVHLLVAGKDCAAAAAEGSKVLVGHTASIYTEVACSCRRPFKVLTRRVCGACPARADCWREEGPLARPRFAGQLFGRKRCHRGERRAGARDQPLSHAPSPR